MNPVGGKPPRLRVVVLTTFFPSPRDPLRTPFLRNLVDALAADCDMNNAFAARLTLSARATATKTSSWRSVYRISV